MTSSHPRQQAQQLTGRNPSAAERAPSSDGPSRRSVTTLLAAGFAAPAVAASVGTAHAADLPAAGPDRADNDVPPLIPAPRRTVSAPGRWRPRPSTRIVVADRELTATAEMLAAELHTEGLLRRPPRILRARQAGPRRPGDIRLALGAIAGTASREAYRLRVRPHGGCVEITGAGPAGAYYGTRTLLQQLRGPQHAVPGGEITDWPEYPQRGLMVDAGRKYFTPEWHAARIRELGWLKLNTYHLHLSDGSGFRLESETHPEIVTRPALSRAEVLELLDLAERHHVTVIPEIDTPGHLEAALAAHPDLQLVTAAGRRHPSNLDYSKPEARAFAHDLIGEIAELFPGPLVHLGGDEYFGYPWDTENKITGENCPQLLDHARREAGPDATLLDGFTHYQNGLIELLGRHGKQAVVWNDHLEPAEGVVELDHRAQVESWIRWNEQLPSAADLLDAGYGIINGHGDHLYFIVNVGQQHEEGKKSAQGIYDLWDPLVFMAAPTRDFRLPAKPAGHRGAHLSVWCDNPGFQTEQEIAEGLRSWLRSFGQQLWGSPRAAADFAAFRPMIDAVGGPPAAAG